PAAADVRADQRERREGDAAQTVRGTGERAGAVAAVLVDAIGTGGEGESALLMGSSTHIAALSVGTAATDRSADVAVADRAGAAGGIGLELRREERFVAGG